MALSFGLSLISEAITAGGASLVLPFAGATALDSRITFTRGSNATMVGSNGLIQYAPHNLLTYSQVFDNAAWTPVSGSVVANSAVAPDGNTTADTLNLSGAGSYLLQNVSITTGVTYTISCYIKTVSGTANIRLVTDGGISTSTDIPVTTSWQRVSFTATSSRSASVGHGLQGQSGGGATSFYIWGAQLNVGALQPYYPTTSAAYYGPRLVYDPVTLAAQGLLIEEQRTNLLTYSEQFDNAAWTKNNLTVTANVIIAPDGLSTSDKLVESNTNSAHYTNEVINLVNGTTYTFSCFFKKAERSFCSMQLPGAVFPNQAAVFDLTNGTIGNIKGTPDAKIVSYGNGWYKCSITGAATSTVDTQIQIFILDSNRDISVGTAYQGDGTSGLYIWGAQLEAGAFATSYIPTTTAQATRAADVATMTGTNFSSWYTVADKTICVDFMPSQVSVYGNVLQIDDGTNSNRISVALLTGATGQVRYDVSSGGVTSINTFPSATSFAANTIVKTAFTMSIGSTAPSNALNGNAATTAVGGQFIPPTIEPAGTLALRIGHRNAANAFLNGTIRSITYYPRRLANSELQALTS